MAPMNAASRTVLALLAAFLALSAQQPPQGGQGGRGPAWPEIREGARLDLEGKSAEAKAAFRKAIDAAPTPAAKANAHRAMALSYAFDGDCRNTGKYEQMVIDYWKTQEAAQPANAFYQEGEMANEAGRVCIENGDFAEAERWYRAGREMGLREPGISPGRKLLWEFRAEHALARLAARRGDKAEAQKHVMAAKAILDQMKTADESLYNQQKVFLPYLTGYVALYTGDPKAALADLQQGNTNDPFIQCLMGMAYEKAGDKAQAMEWYRKASNAGAHNPPAAFARLFTRKKLGGA